MYAMGYGIKKLRFLTQFINVLRGSFDHLTKNPVEFYYGSVLFSVRYRPVFACDSAKRRFSFLADGVPSAA
jgi:hypothetical protein